MEPFTRTAEYDRPVWSPDDSALFFSGGPPRESRICRPALTGSPPHELIRQGACGRVSIHTTTRKLVYSASENGRE